MPWIPNFQPLSFEDIRAPFNGSYPVSLGSFYAGGQYLTTYWGGRHGWPTTGEISVARIASAGTILLNPFNFNFDTQTTLPSPVSTFRLYQNGNATFEQNYYRPEITLTDGYFSESSWPYATWGGIWGSKTGNLSIADAIAVEVYINLNSGPSANVTSNIPFNTWTQITQTLYISVSGFSGADTTWSFNIQLRRRGLANAQEHLISRTWTARHRTA